MFGIDFVNIRGCVKVDERGNEGRMFREIKWNILVVREKKKKLKGDIALGGKGSEGKELW